MPDEQFRIGGGFDHNFVLDRPVDGELALAVRVYEPRSGRVLEVHTTEPGLQFYSGQALGGVVGKGGFVYGPFAGMALETQHFPDSPNHRSFPSTILRPGKGYTSRTVYRFSVA
jgi:aldose 1-epimerase